MALIERGVFRMGPAGFDPEQRPVRNVVVYGFWIGEHPVTVESPAGS